MVGAVSVFAVFLAQLTQKRFKIKAFGDRRVQILLFFGTTVGKNGLFQRFRRPSCLISGKNRHGSGIQQPTTATSSITVRHSPSLSDNYEFSITVVRKSVIESPAARTI